MVLAGLGLLGGSPAAAATSCANADIEATAGQEAQVTSALTCLINEERAKRSLGTLTVNRKLARAALKHSHDMVSRRYFAHTSSGTGASIFTRAKREGYTRKTRSYWLAENIAWGSGSLSSAGAVLQSWLDSPQHRANVLSANARELGLGMAVGSPDGGSDGAIFTLMLGKRR